MSRPAVPVSVRLDPDRAHHLLFRVEHLGPATVVGGRFDTVDATLDLEIHAELRRRAS